MKRRSAIEPVIGHLKNGHRMDRNRLAHAPGLFNAKLLIVAWGIPKPGFI